MQDFFTAVHYLLLRIARARVCHDQDFPAKSQEQYFIMCSGVDASTLSKLFRFNVFLFGLHSHSRLFKALAEPDSEGV